MKILNLTFISAILFLSTTSIAETNIFAPILKCNLSSESIKKVRENRNSVSDSFTILADFESVMDGTDGQAILIESDGWIGIDPSTDQKMQTGIGGGLLGTFYGTQIQKDEFKNGVIFKGNVLSFKKKPISQDTVTLTVISADGKTAKAERKSEPKDESGYATLNSYDCKIGGR